MRPHSDPRKQRTREHIIADLSLNHCERFVFRGGHTADRPFFDYGYDLIIRTFDSNGEVENDSLLVQLKASDSPAYSRDETFVSYLVDRRDISLWQAERVPVIFVIYDAQRDMSYWTHFQSTSTSAGGTIRIPTKNVVNDEGVEAMRRLKNDLFSSR